MKSDDSMVKRAGKDSHWLLRIWMDIGWRHT